MTFYIGEAEIQNIAFWMKDSRNVTGYPTLSDMVKSFTRADNLSVDTPEDKVAYQELEGHFQDLV